MEQPWDVERGERKKRGDNAGEERRICIRAGRKVLGRSWRRDIVGLGTECRVAGDLVLSEARKGYGQQRKC
jgi:hypothetical protein